MTYNSHAIDDRVGARRAVPLQECDWYEQQIGGESPDPGPERREPDTEETRA
jgi:hypothetical protein